MRKPRLLFLASFALVLASPPGRAVAQDDAIFKDLFAKNPELVYRLYPGAYRALPAVYRVDVSGRRIVHSPASIAIDIDRLKTDIKAYREKGELEAGVPDSDYCWELLAMEPDKYLSASEKLERHEQNGPLGFGTAFAIDRNGILVTNRHVIAEQKNGELGTQGTEEMLPTSFINLLRDLNAKLGEWKGAERTSALIFDALAQWYGSHATLTVEISDIAVVVAFTRASLTEQSPGKSAIDMTIAQFGGEARKPVSLPAKVIASSDGESHNDLAILKIQGVVRDALICVPLSPTPPKRGNPAYSLGFPGYRYDLSQRNTIDSANVNVNAGQVVWESRTASNSLSDRLLTRIYKIDENDQKYTLISAAIRGGASGGPVVLDNGSVAAVNVAYRTLPADETPQPTGHDLKRRIQQSVIHHWNNVNLAVTLENLKTLLDKNDIHPDPGPATRDWLAAVDALARHDSATASKLVEEIEKRQYCDRIAKDDETGKMTTIHQRIASHYLESLRELIRADRAKTAATTGEAFPWQPTAFDGFVSAIEFRKPFVVVAVAADGGNDADSADIVKALESDGLVAYRSKASFVKFSYRLSDGTSPDPHGQKIMRHISATALPTLLVIAPTADNLEVVYRHDGPLPMNELKGALDEAFVKALDPKLIGAQ